MVVNHQKCVSCIVASSLNQGRSSAEIEQLIAQRDAIQKELKLQVRKAQYVFTSSFKILFDIR